MESESILNPFDAQTFESNLQQELSDPSPLALLVEKNEVGLFYLKDNIIRYANPTFLQVIRLSSEEAIGRSIFMTVDQEDRHLVEDALERMKTGKIERFSKEIKLHTEEEEVQYFSLHLTLVAKSKTGHLTIIGASRNASSRVKKGIELAQTKAKYEALYRNLKDGIFIYNYIDEKTIDCNEAAISILGYENKEELLKQNRLSLIPKHSIYFPGADLHELTRLHGLEVVKGNSFALKGVLVGKGGQDILADINVVPTHEVLGEAFVIFHDTTNAVLNKFALKANEVKYRTIFENSHEAIVYTDVKSMKPILCNKNALQLFGFDSLEDLVAQSPKDHYADTLVGGMSSKDYAKAKIMAVSYTHLTLPTILLV